MIGGNGDRPCQFVKFRRERSAPAGIFGQHRTAGSCPAAFSPMGRFERESQAPGYAVNTLTTVTPTTPVNASAAMAKLMVRPGCLPLR